MIISRNLINQNIKYVDTIDVKLAEPFTGECQTYTYNDFSRLVDAYKNLFISKGAKKDQTVVIGNQANLSQLALVFACTELGLALVIIGNPYQGSVTPENYKTGQISNKTKQLLPIDFFIIDNKINSNKSQVFTDICSKTIEIYTEVLDYTPNNEIWATDESIVLKCTSSGTTGTPKLIQHTHSFIANLITRNSKMFYGKMGLLTNLAHGSSPAVYFLPGLLSKNVTDYVFLPQVLHPDIGISILDKLGKKISLYLDHLMVPYTQQLDLFFASESKLQNCILYTLGLIRTQWIEKFTKGCVKDIVSIFGTNETSGPFLIARASDIDFVENRYKLCDDFYDLQVDEFYRLSVKMPVYNTLVTTGDLFQRKNGSYHHLGRDNLYRINDKELDIESYNTKIKSLINGQIVIDSVKESIYLAVWDEQIDLEELQKVNLWLKFQSNGLHFITKHAILKQKDYLNGVKVDMEMLREYFRSQ